MVVPVLQGSLRGRKWIVGSSNHGCWLGSYEWKKQRLFTRTVSSGDVVFDIGAHVGFYTLLASVLVGGMDLYTPLAFTSQPTLFEGAFAHKQVQKCHRNRSGSLQHNWYRSFC